MAVLPIDQKMNHFETDLTRVIFILDRVLYAKKTGDEEECTAAVLGGEKITVEEACVSSDRVVARIKLNLNLRLKPFSLCLNNLLQFWKRNSSLKFRL